VTPCRSTVEERVTGRHRRGPRRSVDPDRRERAVIAGPDAPPVEQQAGQVTDVVGVQMGEEHGFQLLELQARLDEGGRRPATAVDDENTPVDDQR
jgi:hypothetical protein